MKNPMASPQWKRFGFLALAGALVSYGGSWPLVAAGIILGAAGFGGFRPPARKGPKEAALGDFPSAPLAWVCAVAAAGGALSFMASAHWPLYDETINGYYALQLDQHWSWRPFFFFSQLPPLYIWLLNLLYRLGGSLLAAIRWEPALLWFLSLPAAYFAARPFLGRSASCLFVLLSGLGFWGLFFSNISHQAVLLLLWLYLLAGLLGRWAGAPEQKKPFTTVALGLVLGTGFYTYFAWPLVALWALAVMAFRTPRKNRARELGLVGIPMGLLVLPMAWAWAQGGYGSYFGVLFSLKPGNDLGGQASDLFWNLAAFLWGDPSPDFTYGPVWGGFFNPLIGAAVLLGLLDLWRRHEEGLSRAFFLGLLLFLLPALLTRHVTLVREIAVLPLLSFAAVRGLAVLFSGWKGKGLAWALGLLLGLSTGLDLLHLVKARDFLGNLQAGQKTIELKGAYQALEALREKQGPGWVLTAFSNDLFTYNRSLSVACYPFNLAQNPHLDPAMGNWTAVVANIHLRPFLAKRFPAASFQWLSDKDHAARDDYNGGLMLVVLPGKPGPDLQAWIDWDGKIRGISDGALDLSLAQSRRQTLAGLQAAFPSLPKDPFLRSCYWEMAYTGYNWIARYDHEMGNLPRTMAILQAGLAEGYPTAYFFNELGSCYVLAGDRARAKDCFGKAVHAPLDLTPAAENLKALEEGGKKPEASKLP